MRHMVIASHAHFAAGISEALALLGGGSGVDIKVICAFVDGNNDIAQAPRSPRRTRSSSARISSVGA